MSTDGQQLDQVQRCLRAWAGFPAGRDPRPLVLLGPSVRAGPFPADGRAKRAFVRGLIEAAPGFPGQILHALRPNRQQAGPPVEPLLVTTATLSTAEFLTDRGQQELPAWEVRAHGVPEPIWVLDPGTAQQGWRPPGLADHELPGDTSTAQLGADRRTITLSFTGIPRAYADYPRADLLEAGAAVAWFRSRVLTAVACRGDRSVVLAESVFVRTDRTAWVAVTGRPPHPARSGVGRGDQAAPWCGSMP